MNQDISATVADDERDEILRGFEIIDSMGRLYGKFRPTELAARQCAADLKWLQDRQPHRGWEMRAIVSVPRETEDGGAARIHAQEQAAVESGWVELDSKQLELPLETEQAVAETRVAAGEYDVTCLDCGAPVNGGHGQCVFPEETDVEPGK